MHTPARLMKIERKKFIQHVTSWGNTPLTQDPGKVSAILGAWDSMPWHRMFRPLLRTDWWLSIYLWCLLGARPIWGFLRGPSERTKGMLVLCFCPGADLAKSSLGLWPSPQRTQVCGFWELNSYPWAVIISLGQLRLIILCSFSIA